MCALLSRPLFETMKIYAVIAAIVVIELRTAFTTKYHHHHHHHHQQNHWYYDNEVGADGLSVARCEAHCWTRLDKIGGKSSCINSCLSKDAVKPGICPEVNATLSPFATACLNACQQDRQCPGVAKCCRHNCGITCQHPAHLLSALGLPPIPQDVRVVEGRRKRTIHIEWDQKIVTPQVTIFVIEERHHTGRQFNPKRLSSWDLCSRTDKYSQTLKNYVKPGRWYQFRVAAVNENGTKGFSEPSPPFILSISPKPPKAPQNVTVGPLWIRNGSISAELRWSPPISDLPLERYKVFWSKRLHGAKALDSVLVHQQIVPKDQTQFLLQNLQPNSLYFLQVQALVQYGKHRLKGEKSGLILNTTNYSNVTNDPLTTKKPDPKRRIEGLTLQKLYWIQGDLRARIIWKPQKTALRYTVNWWTGPCQNNYYKLNHVKMAATTKVPHFDLYDLQFSCRYRVSVREVTTIDDVKQFQDTFLSFSTPKCNDFKSKHRKIKCTNK